MTTKTLYLLRHAHTTKGNAITPDHERELSGGGLEECERIANWLKNNLISIDYVASSDAMRTRQTYGAISALYPLPTPVYSSSLYLATDNIMLKTLQKAPAAASAVLLIGHNPGLHEIALRLLKDEARAEGPLDDGFVTGGLVILSVAGSWDALAYGSCSLINYIRP